MKHQNKSHYRYLVAFLVISVSICLWLFGTDREVGDPQSGINVGIPVAEDSATDSRKKAYGEFTIGDWSTLSVETKQRICVCVSEVVKESGIDLVDPVELAIEIQKFAAVHREDKYADFDLWEFCDIAVARLLKNPLAKFIGSGNDHSKTFVIGSRRKIPMLWQADTDGVFLFSVRDADTDRIVEANAVTTTGGVRNLWMNSGRYYLDVTATGAWEIMLFRSEKQFNDNVDAMPKELFE